MDNARCPFEKVILGTHGNCQKSTRFSMAQQMGVACISDIARNNCLIFLGLMRDRARFALKVTSTAGDLPFGKEMRDETRSAVSEGTFPKPVSLGGRAVGWIESEVQQWLE